MQLLLFVNVHYYFIIYVYWVLFIVRKIENGNSTQFIMLCMVFCCHILWAQLGSNAQMPTTDICVCVSSCHCNLWTNMWADTHLPRAAKSVLWRFELLCKGFEYDDGGNLFEYLFFIFDVLMISSNECFYKWQISLKTFIIIA